MDKIRSMIFTVNEKNVFDVFHIKEKEKEKEIYVLIRDQNEEENEEENHHGNDHENEEEKKEASINVFELYHCELIDEGSYNKIYRSKKKYLLYEKSMDSLDRVHLQTSIDEDKLYGKFDMVKDDKIFRINVDLFSYKYSMIDNKINLFLNKYFTDFTVKTYYNKIFQHKNNNSTDKFCCLIYKYQEKNLLKVIRTVFDKRIKKLHDYCKQEKSEKKTKRIITSVTKLENEIRYIFVLIIKKVIHQLTKAKMMNFFHGDLKINNILCDDEKFLENLNLYFIDFGNSKIQIERDVEVASTCVLQHIGNHKSKSLFYCDVSFFILKFYYYCCNVPILKTFLDPIMLQLYNIEHTVGYLPSLTSVNQIEKEDEWVFYRNDFSKMIAPLDIQLDIYHLKFSLRDNFEEIISVLYNQMRIKIKNKKINVN